MALVSTQPLTEMSTRNLLWCIGRPARKAHNLTAIWEPIVWNIWEPRGINESESECIEVSRDVGELSTDVKSVYF
jgi:hypothetical protein